MRRVPGRRSASCTLPPQQRPRVCRRRNTPTMMHACMHLHARLHAFVHARAYEMMHVHGAMGVSCSCISCATPAAIRPAMRSRTTAMLGRAACACDTSASAHGREFGLVRLA